MNALKEEAVKGDKRVPVREHDHLAAGDARGRERVPPHAHHSVVRHNPVRPRRRRDRRPSGRAVLPLFEVLMVHAAIFVVASVLFAVPASAQIDGGRMTCASAADLFDGATLDFVHTAHAFGFHVGSAMVRDEDIKPGTYSAQMRLLEPSHWRVGDMANRIRMLCREHPEWTVEDAIAGAYYDMIGIPMEAIVENVEGAQ